MRVVVLIPARGGSKRVPKKNLKKIDGKPMVWYAIEAAVRSLAHEIWVSTDDKKIKRLAIECGVKVLDRPKELATDDTLMKDVVLHFAENVEFDVLILITPTYPLIQAKDINMSLNKFWKEESDSLLTVSRKKMFRWKKSEKYDGYISVDYDINDRPMMQDYMGFLVEDGGIYITTKDNLLKTGCFLNGDIGCYVINHPSIDVDTEDDFKIVEALWPK